MESVMGIITRVALLAIELGGLYVVWLIIRHI